MADLTISPSNVSQYQDTSSASPIEFLLPDSNSSMKEFAPVHPLFSGGVSDLRPWGLGDSLYHVTVQNYLNITSHWIAYMSCDSEPYSGYIGIQAPFNTALAANVTAILLYSLTADYCSVSQYQSSYPYIYTMTSASASQDLLDRIEAAPTEFPLHGTISFADQVDKNNGTDGNSSQSSSSNNSSNNQSLGASPTTAVAMIILYSITGIITALFLIIIITGAVRAHRHPERYGPRNTTGRARQSRARGLARAMLDTIPIVKFGDQHDAPKATDVEMVGHGPAEEITPVNAVPVIAIDKSAAQDSETETAEPRPRRSTHSARSGISPAINAIESSPAENSNGEAPGCSICTEDFQMGEDLRVLPCDHKFHPPCIDPWLLNVSGTCPLCRIDLNPQPSAEGAEATETGDLPPPIDSGEATTTPRARIGMRQSFLIGLGLGRVHDTTREERIQAVRALRLEQNRLREQRAQAAAEEAADERTRRQRFRERFGIRTRRRGQEEESREEGAPAAAPDSTDAVEGSSPSDTATRET